jgi:uncharacterized paraquat-inducible protein A
LIANIVPLLSFEMKNIATQSTPGSRIKSQYTEHMYFVVAVVAFATAAAPAIILKLSLYI